MRTTTWISENDVRILLRRIPLDSLPTAATWASVREGTMLTRHSERDLRTHWDCLQRNKRALLELGVLPVWLS